MKILLKKKAGAHAFGEKSAPAEKYESKKGETRKQVPSENNGLCHEYSLLLFCYPED